MKQKRKNIVFILFINLIYIIFIMVSFVAQVKNYLWISNFLNAHAG